MKQRLSLFNVILQTIGEAGIENQRIQPAWVEDNAENDISHVSETQEEATQDNDREVPEDNGILEVPEDNGLDDITVHGNSTPVADNSCSNSEDNVTQSVGLTQYDSNVILNRSVENNSGLVDSDGFQMVYTRSQLRNYRRNQKRERLRVNPVPYGLRSRARHFSQ